MAKTVLIIDEISKDLALRNTAEAFFNKLEQIQDQVIIVDFSNTNSISRSFAHEYLTKKNTNKKTISEANLPLLVQKMFDIVKKSSDKSKLIDVDSPSVVTI